MLLQNPPTGQADRRAPNDIGAAPEDLSVIQPAPMRILTVGSPYLAGAGFARNGPCLKRRCC